MNWEASNSGRVRGALTDLVELIKNGERGLEMGKALKSVPI